MIRVPWQISMSINGCNRSGEWEIDDEDWDGQTEEQRTAMLDEMMQTEMGNHIDAGYGDPIKE